MCGAASRAEAKVQRFTSGQKNRVSARVMFVWTDNDAMLPAANCNFTQVRGVDHGQVAGDDEDRVGVERAQLIDPLRGRSVKHRPAGLPDRANA